MDRASPLPCARRPSPVHALLPATSSSARNVDVRRERAFWACYERLVRPLPAGGLQHCWRHCLTLYERRLTLPDESAEQAVTALLDIAPQPRPDQLALLDLHLLIRRRMQALERQRRQSSRPTHRTLHLVR
ncbi:hypothetical protein RZA67_07480 [Stenotrophomonas sp. C3(2023)]|uniref:hypothetical protein n=1 Tax=Stenotrophomonas sp. C3(2023) TaxID=3080277 RepID=UPI00293C5D88|nr:hypothetical protein [Stenotrophomonas sp. C3(2023)]MDV3468568.1 hypothetical protein [Stenotrophomonas sp. C3(2023)]